jgi:uncharacterized protein (TIGR03086 family)
MMDIEPATRRMSTLLASIGDDQLELPTPCPSLSVGDLCDHISTFATAFTAVAQKDTSRTGTPPPPDAANLEAGWRARVAGDLETLAGAWREPESWQGMTKAGPFEMPGEVAGLVALDELVLHGWDLAVATGQSFEPSSDDVEGALGFVKNFDAPRDGGLFGPIVPVADDAPPLHQLLGLAGRDPNWSPSTP